MFPSDPVKILIPSIICLFASKLKFGSRHVIHQLSFRLWQHCPSSEYLSSVPRAGYWLQVPVNAAPARQWLRFKRLNFFHIAGESKLSSWIWLQSNLYKKNIHWIEVGMDVCLWLWQEKKDVLKKLIHVNQYKLNVFNYVISSEENYDLHVYAYLHLTNEA